MGINDSENSQWYTRCPPQAPAHAHGCTLAHSVCPPLPAACFTTRKGWKHYKNITEWTQGKSSHQTAGLEHKIPLSSLWFAFAFAVWNPGPHVQAILAVA